MFDPTTHGTNRILTISFLCQLRRLSECSVMPSLTWLPPLPLLLTLQLSLQLQNHRHQLHPPPLLSPHQLHLPPFLNVLFSFPICNLTTMPPLMISNSWNLLRAWHNRKLPGRS